MSALARISSALEVFTGRARKQSDGPPGGFSLGTTWFGGPMFTDAFASKRAPSPWELVEKYKGLCYAMVSLKANAFANVPLKLYSDSTRGDKPRSLCDPRPITPSIHRHLRKLGYTRAGGSYVDDIHEIRHHPLLEMLDNPDPVGDFDRTWILGLISRYCDVVGSAYFYPEGPTNRPPQWFWPLFSQYVIPVREAGSPRIANYRYFAETFEFEELARFRMPGSLRDPYATGFSPCYAAFEYMGLEDKFVAIQDQLLGMGPRPNIIGSPKDPNMPPGEPERQRFAMDLNRQLSRSGAGGVLLTNGSWEFQPVSYSPSDLSGLKISEYDLERIANIFGVPVPYLTGETNLANLQAADTQFARNAIMPLCKIVASRLTRLAKRYDNRLFFAFDPCIPEDEERTARIVDMQLKSGQITINQANQDNEYPPVPWGDEPWLSSSLQQPSMAKESHEQSLAKGEADLSLYEDDEDEDEDEGEYEGEDGEAIDDEDQAEEITEDEDEEARSIIRKGTGNPYHDAEGHFTNPAGVGHKTGQTKSKRKRKKKTKPGAKKTTRKPTSSKKTTGKKTAKTSKKTGKSSGRKPSGGGGGGSRGTTNSTAHTLTEKEKADRLSKGKPLEGLSEKAIRAQKSQNKTTGEVQEYTKNNEYVLANRLKGKAFPDNGPIDVQLEIDGRTRGVELKTITHGRNNKITMSKSAIGRKVAWEKENGSPVETVVLDHRDRFAGGKNAALYSGNEIYYKRGVGSFRIGQMHPVKNDRELKRLMKLPYDKLPEAAKGEIRAAKF